MSSSDKKPVGHLIVDSSAFIRNAPIKDLTDLAFSVDGVVGEIRDANTRASLQVLPYTFVLKQPGSEHVKFVTDFSKKTGDYYNLSSVDLQLVALAYQLAKENLSSQEFATLRTEPVKNHELSSEAVAIQSLKLNKPVEIAGFYLPKKTTVSKEKEHEIESDADQLPVDKLALDEVDDNNNSDKNEAKERENNEGDNEEEDGEDDEDKDDEDEDEDDEEDDEGWITPGNLEQIRRKNQMGDDEKEEIRDTQIKVGCMTSDFSMQNVLIQIGIPVLSVDGLLIKKARSYVLKCITCSKVTTNMSKQFCPQCGYKTLERVLVTVDADGNKVYRGRRKPASTKGLRFSLPKPCGGKHSNYPILSEDQPRAQNLPSKKALIKNNPLDPDYVCQSSPFVTKDVFSKAAQLGYRSPTSATSRFNRRK